MMYCKGVEMLHVDTFYEQNLVPTKCTICGRSTCGRFSPPVRYVLADDEEEIGDVCERCAYGPVELWRIALMDHAARLEMQAASLRALATRVEGGSPAPEGIVEDVLREFANRTRPHPPSSPSQHDD